jgi:hypothetical protein
VGKAGDESILAFRLRCPVRKSSALPGAFERFDIGQVLGPAGGELICVMFDFQLSD